MAMPIEEMEDPALTIDADVNLDIMLKANECTVLGDLSCKACVSAHSLVNLSLQSG